MKTLQTYLRTSKTSQTQFASRLSEHHDIHVSQGYISEIASGVKRPSLALAVAIENATKGAVKPASFIANCGALK